MYLSRTLNRSEILIRNFAEGGATVDADLIPAEFPYIRSLTQQVRVVGPWG